MTSQIINVTIEGKTPLLMHRFPLEPIEAIEKKTPAEQAEISAYRDPDNGTDLYVPGVNLLRALVSGASFSKGKGRATLQKLAAACLMVAPERLSLGIREYSIDSRAVVMPSTRGRIVRHRPRVDQWQLSFELSYDDALLSAAQMRRIVDDTGDRVGLLDFRPEQKGPYGRFFVIAWKR